MGKVVKSNNTMNYNGTVTVKVVGTKNKLKKQFKVKNSGYQPLFDYIAYCLAGSFNASLCPNYIVTYYDEHEVFASASPTCSRPVSKVSSYRVSGGTNVGITEMTFTIPGTSMASGSQTNILALYCDDKYNTYNTANKEPSAVVVLEDEVEVSSDESVIIVWQLSIGNKEETVESNE